MRSEDSVKLMLKEVTDIYNIVNQQNNDFGLDDEIFSDTKIMMLTTLQFGIELLLIILELKTYKTMEDLKSTILH